MNPRNKHWRRQKLVQKYITRLKKFPASSYGLWCDNYNQHWSYKTTSTPCSCVKVKDITEETKLEIEMF